MVNFRSLIILVAFMFTSVSCASNERVIYYYIGCDNPEVYSDIEESISGVADFAKKNNIKLIAREESKTCGYLFAQSGSEKYIRSALTDVDLILLSNEFF